MSGPLNGKTGEMVRWVIGLVLCGIIAYFTAQSSINARIAVVETSERQHFEEIQRTLVDIKQELRDMRAEMAKRR